MLYLLIVDNILSVTVYCKMKIKIFEKNNVISIIVTVVTGATDGVGKAYALAVSFIYVLKI